MTKSKTSLRTRRFIAQLSRDYSIRRSTDGLRYYPQYAVEPGANKQEAQKVAWLYYYDEQADDLVHFSSFKDAEDWLLDNYLMK